jgi:hypothetical protein
MAGFFRKMFGATSQAPSFDPENEAAKLLAILPPCSQNVVVASDRYSGKYRCEVSVPASHLMPFVEKLVSSTIGGSQESRVARIALPRWLRSASTDDGKSSYLPPQFVDILDVYVLNFIMNGVADIYCKDCGKKIDYINQNDRNQQGGGPWSEWTSSWRCPEGHLLYTEDHELHILRSPSRS